ncbi:hypothetical protein ABT299_43895 [Spirillospora sp. NPDC000708]
MSVDRLLVNLDLNLLVTLDVLLRERNVARWRGCAGTSATSCCIGRAAATS